MTFKKIAINISFLIVAIIFSHQILVNAGFKQDNNIRTADFKCDINRITEASMILEIERLSGKSEYSNPYGTTGQILTKKELNKDLLPLLTRLGDINTDGSLDDAELANLKIMPIDKSQCLKVLKTLGNPCLQCNIKLKEFIIITSGKEKGTVLYNGSKCFYTPEGERIFGL